MPLSVFAQSMGCFQSLTYNGQYTGIPTQSNFVNSISATTPNVLVSQTVPQPKNSAGLAIGMIVCPTANGNYNLQYCSANGCSISTTTVPGGTVSNGSALNFTPSCIQLNPISGSMPNIVWATVDNSATVIKLPHWLDKPCP